MRSTWRLAAICFQLFAHRILAVSPPTFASTSATTKHRNPHLRPPAPGLTASITRPFRRMPRSPQRPCGRLTQVGGKLKFNHIQACRRRFNRPPSRPVQFPLLEPRSAICCHRTLSQFCESPACARRKAFLPALNFRAAFRSAALMRAAPPRAIPVASLLLHLVAENNVWTPQRRRPYCASGFAAIQPLLQLRQPRAGSTSPFPHSANGRLRFPQMPRSPALCSSTNFPPGSTRGVPPVRRPIAPAASAAKIFAPRSTTPAPRWLKLQ